MMSAIPEVIQIQELRADAGDHIAKSFLPFINHLTLIHVVIRIGRAVEATADRELVKMIVLPVHDDLWDVAFQGRN